MLGQDVVARLRAADQDVSVSTQADLDITDAAACAGLAARAPRAGSQCRRPPDGRRSS